ncbi:hypothetical protein KCV01_g36, partial [Aureobasidium melanogenum]
LSLATVLGLLGVRQGKTSGWTSENSLVGSLYSFMGSGHGSPGGGGVGCCHISFHISGGDLRCIDRTVILDDRKLFGDATGNDTTKLSPRSGCEPRVRNSNSPLIQERQAILTTMMRWFTMIEQNKTTKRRRTNRMEA